MNPEPLSKSSRWAHSTNQEPKRRRGFLMRKLIIDTDTAADDSFALLVGLLHPQADLKAITIVAGNVDFTQQVQNALITIDQAGRSGEVPVFKGATDPLTRPWLEASAHGDGKGNVDWPQPRQLPESIHAAEAIVKMANENPGDLDILAIGPLTNIALALALDRDLPKKIGELWIMGGCDNSIGNVTAAAEYNFYVDPEAAQMVMATGFDVTIVTWTLTLASATWTSEQLGAIRDLETPLAHFFSVLDTPNKEYNESVGVPGSTHPDSLTAMLMVEPSLILRSSRRRVEIETQSNLTRGYSLMDPREVRRVNGKEFNATVIDEIDALGFYTRFVELLSSPIR
ncbi:MAG: nucleoside hydrolase [Pontimonas sp.]|nr:nucleoside hydrolase [Pontimonas sp.]